MSTQMGVVRIFDALNVVKSTAATSAAVDIGKAQALALHILTLTGANPDFTYTYKLSNAQDGTYVTPASPVTIGANITTVDVLDFAPEAAGWIKIIATNNNAANDVVLTAQIAVQED